MDSQISLIFIMHYLLTKLIITQMWFHLIPRIMKCPSWNKPQKSPNPLILLTSK